MRWRSTERMKVNKRAPARRSRKRTVRLPVCPKCGSTDVESLDRRMLAVRGIVHHLPRYECKECGHIASAFPEYDFEVEDGAKGGDGSAPGSRGDSDGDHDPEEALAEKLGL